MAQDPKRGVEYAALLLTTIKNVRATHHACTAREVARLLRQTHTLTNRHLFQLRDLGLCDWSDDGQGNSFPGSLRVTLKGGRFITDVAKGKVTSLGQLTKSVAE